MAVAVTTAMALIGLLVVTVVGLSSRLGTVQDRQVQSAGLDPSSPDRNGGVASSAQARRPNTDTPRREGEQDSPIAPPTGPGDRVLTIGTLLPMSGELQAIGHATRAAAELAVDDINERGGVLGREVRLVHADSAAATDDAAATIIAGLAADRVDVVVGAISSSVTRSALDRSVELGLMQISPASEDAALTTWDDDGLFFRTAASEVRRGVALADIVIDDGHDTATVIHRDDELGRRLASSFQARFERRGGSVAHDRPLAYPARSEDFGAVVDMVETAGSDATVLIISPESGPLMSALHRRGLGPSSAAVYSVDGNIAALGTQVPDPAILAGLIGVEPSVDPSVSEQLIARVDARSEGGIHLYTAETYDAVIITALAATQASSDRPTRVAAVVNDVTRRGQRCTRFGPCADLLADGINIDYDGVGGPYDFSDAGEPSLSSYRIATYDGADRPSIELDRYLIAGR